MSDLTVCFTTPAQRAEGAEGDFCLTFNTERGREVVAMLGGDHGVIGVFFDYANCGRVFSVATTAGASVLFDDRITTAHNPGGFRWSQIWTGR